VIGRAPESDLRLDDPEVSRRHARVSAAADGSALVEDLGSANGTFVNHNRVFGTARLDPGDEVLIGVTVIQVCGPGERTLVRPLPPALASAPRPPSYVRPSELDKLLDVNVRRRAQLAPLALFMLVSLVLIIYFATR
jgi:S-DNA-T family DNA segregation ATPase FtsK/SpoIIIE